MHNFRHVETICDLTPDREDAILLGDNIFGVFDGAGSLVKFSDSKGNTGGRLAATIARDAFTSCPGDLYYGGAALANREIRKYMKMAGVDVSEKVNLWCTTAAVIQLREDHNYLTWLQIGDSVILLVRNDGSFELLVPYHDHDRELLAICKKLSEGGEKDPHSVIVANGMARALREEINVAYGDLTGEKEAMSWVESGGFPIFDFDHILLYTDGLLIPKEDPMAENDWQKTVELFLDGGLKNVVNYVRRLQDADPHCSKYTRYKQYDDIAAIAISRKK